ncbi:MAG: TfoX/Sxy family protein [candidate division Zixibacteria bacterium]|nr:TfoX/Sxy family protein [candidate division Zixibacteria bacterium]
MTCFATLPALLPAQCLRVGQFYRNGIISGIIIDGELYFKVDDRNRAKYERLESRQFVYRKSAGKPVTMPYWLVPAEVMEDKESSMIT